MKLQMRISGQMLLKFNSVLMSRLLIRFIMLLGRNHPVELFGKLRVLDGDLRGKCKQMDSHGWWMPCKQYNR